MARFALIRGWIECSFEDVVRIREIVQKHWADSSQAGISRDSAHLYLQGWGFPETPINWTSVVFFGADVNENAVPFIRDCLLKISSSGMEVSGFFHVDDEEGEDLQMWTIKDGQWSEVKRSE